MTNANTRVDPRTAESTRKQLLERIHRIIDGYEDGGAASSCMDAIMRIVGRKK